MEDPNFDPRGAHIIVGINLKLVGLTMFGGNVSHLQHFGGCLSEGGKIDTFVFFSKSYFHQLSSTGAHVIQRAKLPRILTENACSHLGLLFTLKYLGRVRRQKIQFLGPEINLVINPIINTTVNNSKIVQDTAKV